MLSLHFVPSTSGYPYGLTLHKGSAVVARSGSIPCTETDKAKEALQLSYSE